MHGDPHKSPLPSMIVRRTADSIDLSNGIRLEVRPASFRTLRGPTYIAVIADEIAFWYTSVDYANPDTEILAAVRPGLLTTHGPLLMASSVYAKTGVLYDSYKRYFGPAGPPDILVAHASSRDLNPSISQAEIDLALERDPVANRAEYLSEWRSDVEGFIPRDIVEFCVRNYIELPPQPNTNYVCFIDQATGVPEGDSFAAVVAHLAGDRVTVDAVREVRPPFNFFEVVGTVLLPLCTAYHIYQVVGDNYAGELAKQPVRKAGISFELAEKHKTQLYADPFLGLLNAARSTCRATSGPSTRSARWSARCSAAAVIRSRIRRTGTMTLPMRSLARLISRIPTPDTIDFIKGGATIPLRSNSSRWNRRVAMATGGAQCRGHKYQRARMSASASSIAGSTWPSVGAHPGGEI